MYSILLVDDEARVRNSIIEKTPWQELGFEKAREASNGLEALELFEDQRFDVIITDIQMPYINGIEFIEKVREIDPAVTIIIISGYDEFTYAQSAIKYDVLEYVLKPLNIEDIKKLLKRTKNSLDEQHAKYLDQIRLKHTYERELPSLKDKFLISLLTAPELLITQEIESSIERYALNLKPGYKSVLLLEATDKCSNWSNSSLSLLRILKDPIAKNNNICYFQMAKYIVVIHSVKYKDGNNQIYIRQTQRLVNQIRSYANKFGVTSFSIGIGSLVSKYLDLHQSYQKALTALNYSYSNNVEDVYFDDIVINKEQKEIFDSQKKKELALAIKSNNTNYIKDSIKSLFSHIDLREIQPRLIDIVAIINECGESYNLSLYDFNYFRNDKENIFNALSNIKTASSAQDWAIKACVATSEQLNNLREKSHIKFVEDAKRQIEQNYTNAYYSLEELCEVISISPSYFSSTFKKEVGKSFVQYLTEKRMEYAKNLLDHSDMKTYEIAKKVGFAESNYFSYCFKKYSGVSPSTYRNK